MSTLKAWSKSDFIFKKQLGMGQFGVVYEAVERSSSFPVAVKIIAKNKVNSEVLIKRLKREIEVHSRLKYEHICGLYGYFSDQNHIYLVLQFCAHGNLYTPIKQLKERMTDRKIASIVQQLLSAIAYLSARYVMHRDIKLQNILFDQNYNVKLTDFGCSVHSVNSRKTVCGTIQYLCPEMINEQLYGHQVDLYCLGIVTYELYYFQSPFYDKQEEQIYKNIKEGVIIFDEAIRVIPQSAKELINILIKSSKKPSASELMGHSFFKQYLQDAIDNLQYKMQLDQDKITDFFKLYFRNTKNTLKQSPSSEFTKINLFLKSGLDFRSYKNPSANFPKPIRQFGFIKKYDKICTAIPHVSAFRAEQIETIQIVAIIDQVYDCYLNFIKQGLWKNQTQQSYLQQLTLLYLHQLYTKGDSKTRKKYIAFDRYLLNVFYTINILKTCNRYVKNFANFLNSSYSFGELFLYICLKNVAIRSNEDEMVESRIIKKIIKIFQAEDLSHNVSISISKDSFDTDEGKLVSINSMFVDPLGGALAIPTVKLYKIMKICKVMGNEEIEEKQTVQWEQFLKKYFQYIEEQVNISFQHVVCAAVAKNTFQLSKKLLAGQNTQIQQQFLQEAFAYVFQVLEMVFRTEEPILTDQKSHNNIMNLRKHYEYMKGLNEYEIALTNKFSKKLLKNSYILQLYKKYC